MICDSWELVAVPFPFMETPASKRRPALILSSREFNYENGHSIMVMITTAVREQWPWDYQLQSPTEAGLNVDCVVRWKTFTLPNTMIAKKIGVLAAGDREQLIKKAQTIFVWAS